MKVGEVLLRADRAILDKETLTSSDVKEYLEQNLAADKILMEGLQGKSSKRLQEAYLRSQKHLKDWDRDRSDALFELLYYVNNAKETGRLETMEVCTRCSIALSEEPLIPSLDKSEYHRIVSVSNIALKSANKEGDELTIVYRTYALAILYNADRFCPQIFLETVPEEAVQKSRQGFLDYLEILQGHIPLKQ